MLQVLMLAGLLHLQIFQFHLQFPFSPEIHEMKALTKSFIESWRAY
jgi:hypothetical protein